MGCCSSKIKDEEVKPLIKNETDENNLFGTKEEQIAIKKFNQKQNDIIDKFNKKKGNSNNVGLSNISSCYIKYRNTSKGPIYTVESNAENVLKFLENVNPFNEEINNNKDINKLQKELYQTELYYSNVVKPNSPNLQIKSTQKIHNKYNLSLKLKNIKTNLSKTFDFNNLDKPLLIIFFDILSEKALNKIKEFKKNELELINQETKNFLLLPIVNIFVDQYENVCNNKKYKKIFDIVKENSISQEDDYFVLIKNINEHFTQLFQLDQMKQSKCVIINRNSEISLILDEKIEYLNYDMIDFFLNTRNSEYSKDYFNFENKQQIIDILDKNCKEINDKFCKKYLFEIDLKVISSEKKLPVYLRFTYHEKDKQIAENLYKQVTDEIKTKVKKVFCTEYMIKDNKNELVEMIKYFKNKIDNDIFTYKKKEQNKDYFSFILKCNSIIINDNNNKCNNSNNNEICKNKKYLLNYYTDQQLYISELIYIFSSNIYKTPKYSNLNCNYQIFPIKGTKIKSIIPKYKEIIITKEVITIKNDINESDFDIQKNQTEVILIIHHNILSIKKEQKKIAVILEALYNNGIKFVLLMFGENESDAQKLNEISWDKFYLNEKDKKFKIIYLNICTAENFHQFCFFSEEIFFKMFRINKDNHLLELYNLDSYDCNHFTLSSIKNRNIFNFLVYISKKDNIDINDNNIPNNDENDYKRFKEHKKKICQLISNTDLYNKDNNNKLFTDLNISFIYNKYFIFPEDNSNSRLNKIYGNANIILTYLDCIKDNNFEEIKKIINDNNINNNGKSSSINIKIKEEKIKTIKLLDNIQSVFECPKCNRSYTFDQNSFYFCNKCKENAFFCQECYTGFHESKKGKKKKKTEDNNKIFHEHQLILFYNYNRNKSSYIIKEEFNKYMNLIGNNKLKKNYKVICSICDVYKSLVNSNIIISHLKKKKIENIYKNESMEIIVCDKCFKSNHLINILSGDNTNNNVVVL